MSLTVFDLDTLWTPANPAAAEAVYRARLAECRALPERDLSHEIELLAMVARAEAGQKKTKDALATLEVAEKLLADAQGGLKVAAQIRYLVERGRLFIDESTPARARPLFSQAWTLAVNSGEDFFTVDIARLMAGIEPQKSQEEWLLKAIQIAEQSPQDKARRWLGGLYAALAWKVYDLRQFERALEAHQRSLSHFRQRGSEHEVFVARWSVGRVLRQMGRVEEALVIQQSLLAEVGKEKASAGRLYEELAECLHAVKKLEEAQSYFAMAHEELSKDDWIPDGQPLQMKRLKTLGKVETIK